MKAFPWTESDTATWDNGMDLRDYFAAKIMQGFVQGLVNIDKEDNQKTSETTAIMAYKFADEMMEARK